jgi:hypothetical protein
MHGKVMTNASIKQCGVAPWLSSVKQKTAACNFHIMVASTSAWLPLPLLLHGLWIVGNLNSHNGNRKVRIIRILLLDARICTDRRGSSDEVYVMSSHSQRLSC